VGQNGRWQRYPAPAILADDETVSSLCQSRDGTLWVGRYARSLCRIRNGISEVETRSQLSRIRALFEDRENGLWIGSADQGVESIQGEEVRRWGTTNGLSNNRVTAIAQDGTGDIWIGTDDGLNRIRDGKVDHFFAKDGLRSSQVHSLFTDREGVLWIGTPGAGITRYRQGRFAVATSQHGLHSDVIAQILEDDEGHLWIGSTTGIFRVEKQSLHDVLDGRSRFVRSTVFGRKDGMRAAGCPGGFQPVCAKTGDGRLWFCTSAGVTVIDPRTLRRTELPPPVHIERLLVDGIELDARTNSAPSLASGLARAARVQASAQGTGLPLASDSSGSSSTRVQPDAFRVPPGARRLEIHCTALSLSDPEHAQFKFWLEGYEEDWQEAGSRRVAYYTGVPPGAYRFRAKAANSNGAWNEEEATLALVIQPAWHQSVWFRSAAAVAGLAVLFAAYRLKVGGLHMARAQHAAFSRRLIESQEAERKRIAGELHDSLGQSLLVINNRSRLVLNSPATLETAREQLREISNLASQAVEEVRTIAQNLRPYQLDRLGLTRALHFLLQNVSASSAIRVVDEIDPVDNLLPREIEVHLFRIAQEFLNNAVKHSGAGSVRMSIRRGEKKLDFAFEDNGRGFDLRAESMGGGRDRGLGLQSMTERLRILGARADFQSQPGQGTRLQFILPLPFPKHEPAD
jgi:signal transduction histidine kinase